MFKKLLTKRSVQTELIGLKKKLLHYRLRLLTVTWQIKYRKIETDAALIEDNASVCKTWCLEISLK